MRFSLLLESDIFGQVWSRVIYVTPPRYAPALLVNIRIGWERETSKLTGLKFKISLQNGFKCRPSGVNVIKLFTAVSYNFS